MTSPAVLRILIVDDEPMARRRLQRMLDGMSGMEVVGQAGDGRQAVEAIDRLIPDIVLLDVRMPGLDGLAVARHLEKNPQIIFTTAHADFALDAFQVEALDYLLKPVDPKRLERALQRARAAIERHDVADLAAAVGRLVDSSAATRVPTRVSARRGHKIYYFDPREIDLFQASEKYVAFVHHGAKYLTEESLSSLEQRLSTLGFLRVHRGALLRVDAVRALSSDVLGGAAAELQDGTEVPVSRRRVQELRSRLDDF